MNSIGMSLDDGVLSDFADSALGRGLAPEPAALIAQAGQLRHQPEQALPLLERARAMAPSHPVPLIALYRFHFYNRDLERARAVGEDALAIARTALGPNFGDQPPSDDQARHDAAVRFYLFTLKGLAYIGLRLGEREEARLLLNELRRLDPGDRVGAALLAHVLQRYEAMAEGLIDPAEGPGAYPAYGWGEPPR